ncbi:MAG: DUF3800 domain-containing protein [Candidatus Edwardsbacteria bacterium]|nr:DUF3800 domain-containing protein [Candidatus Edwardsbacteria bacterium]
MPGRDAGDRGGAGAVMKCRIYIDEVGNPDLENSDNPNHRFLSLTGIIGNLRYFDAVVHPQMESLKRRYLNYHADEPVVFHRKEMMNADPPFERFKDANTRKLFDEELIKLLTDWEYTVVSVCLDKKRHKEIYDVWRYDPYHYCLALILERYLLFLRRKGCMGDVMAESRGGKEDMRLKSSFLRLVETGTDYIKPELFKNVLTSKELKVKPKLNNIAGLQIADLVAHTSRDEILKEHGYGYGKNMTAFTERMICLLQNKYDRADGKIYGKKFI